MIGGGDLQLVSAIGNNNNNSNNSNSNINNGPTLLKKESLNYQ